MVIASRYKLLEEIGHGGEARVFRGVDVTTGTEVAVRIPIRAGFGVSDSAMPAMHPGWVQLLNQGTTPEGSFQVFELVVGETLGARVSRAVLEPDDWLEFVRQSLDAVEALHRAGWVHGDINADNFMMTEGATWKLLELPFLRFEAPEKRSALYGSIYTLSPEQLRGTAGDSRSDLYALGCLYYYAACGEYPNTGARSQDIAIDRLRFAAAPLGEKAADYTGPRADWVMRLLEREAHDRPADIAAARQLLDE